uniref:CW-type domain-containing protein n=1 Tax=Leersia perrieri TaxID=77586 RepID=A0A0D9WGC5_9ORYZ
MSSNAANKWRIISSKEEYGTIRANFTMEPWFCSKKTDCSCEHPEEIQYDTSRIWVLDSPNIPKPPPQTERLQIMRSDLSKLDRAKGKTDVDRFLKDNPEYTTTLSASNFDFSTPKIIKETISESAKWAITKAGREAYNELATDVPSASGK